MLIAPPIMDDHGLGMASIAMDAIRECPPYGIYLLHAVLCDAGYDAFLVDLIAPGTESVQDQPVEDMDLIAIGATSMSWPTALRVVAQIRTRNPNVPIVVGGIHPTMFDWYLMSEFDIDFVIRGEGEVALVALVEAIRTAQEPSTVPNLTWRSKEGKIVRNPAGRQLSAIELATAALPKYELLPKNVYQGLSIESSRGCAFDCSFCSTSYRKSFRAMPAQLFVDRLEYVIGFQDRTRQPFTHIVDDEFTLNVKRAVDIASEIHRRGLQPAIVYDSRATDLLKGELVENLAPYTYQFLLGAECGYDEGLKKIGKGTTTEILTQVAKILNKNGIADRADFSFILGLPWETAKEVEATCRFALGLNERYGVRVLLQWYCQIPGSRLWQEARDLGLVSEAMYNEPGFFRNLYLFRSAVKLTNEEIDRISRLVRIVGDVAAVKADGRRMVEYSHPESLRIYFPPGIYGRPNDSLQNLREVARADHRRVYKEKKDLGHKQALVNHSIDFLAGRPPKHPANVRADEGSDSSG
ncbi:radical SAM protein [Rhodococcus sp. IEGM 1351]|uniref:B12-binding domain-containing radical SAM protein n=1 Tax=Rhodococcus sp. IEGM 1351 TaxID=3047089 RepID=UPI0024B87651|nr:radical SAM protein [Rhodococcus sp. IEGM 1351]MDI9940336.1 radical SAM protein [Rhodococcus sp. IEGM 1351]